MALFNGKLFLAYKGKDSDDLWFNTFDGHSWLATDLEITQNGHSKTDARPALAVFNGKLFLAYKGSGSNDLWFNTFDGASWLATDLEDHPERTLQDRRRPGARRVQRQALPRLQGLRQRRSLVQHL